MITINAPFSAGSPQQLEITVTNRDKEKSRKGPTKLRDGMYVLKELMEQVTHGYTS